MISVVFRHIFLLNLVVSYYRKLHSLLAKFVFSPNKEWFRDLYLSGNICPTFKFYFKINKATRLVALL